MNRETFKDTHRKVRLGIAECEAVTGTVGAPAFTPAVPPYFISLYRERDETNVNACRQSHYEHIQQLVCLNELGSTRRVIVSGWAQADKLTKLQLLVSFHSMVRALRAARAALAEQKSLRALAAAQERQRMEERRRKMN